MEIVHTARVDSPIGALRLATTGVGLLYIELPHASGGGLAGWLRQQASGARVQEGFRPNREAARQVVEFLEGKRTAFDLPLDLRGSEFQLAVWRALLTIPYGETRTYADIAAAVGRPTALRPVGAANGANPVPLIVPCHRVVAASGRLGGYGGGVDLKARLLAMERRRPHEGDLL